MSYRQHAGCQPEARVPAASLTATYPLLQLYLHTYTYVLILTHLFQTSSKVQEDIHTAHLDDLSNRMIPTTGAQSTVDHTKTDMSQD